MSGLKNWFARTWRKALQALRDPYGAWSPARIVVASLVGLLLLGAIGGGAFALSSSGSGASAATSSTTSTTVKVVSHKVHHKPKPVVAVTCPLTGVPAPGGKIPQRPVLAVKVGNDPAARPQSGLQDADVVYDTLAEGGITRYIAVYQCNTSTSIGPIRSVRWDDWHILQQFGRADLAFVHGITPDVSTVQSLSWVCDLDAFAHPNLYQQNPARYAPESTYTSTAALWSGCPKGPAPPSPFTFSKRAVAVGSVPVSSVNIDYNFDEANILWQWSRSHHAFMHNFEDFGTVTPDVSPAGVQLHATNVVIEVVQIQYGPYAETPGSTGDVESITEGSGKAFVLRGGRVQIGTWVRPSWSNLTKLVSANGKPMALSPGNTWVEIVPASDSITFTPSLPKRLRG
jgi:hypothetical protein